MAIVVRVVELELDPDCTPTQRPLMLMPCGRRPQGRHSGHLCSVGGAAGEKLEPYSVAIRPEGPILVDFSALRAGFSTHIQWREGDTAQPNIHIQWSVPSARISG